MLIVPLMHVVMQRTLYVKATSVKVCDLCCCVNILILLFEDNNSHVSSIVRNNMYHIFFHVANYAEVYTG